MKRGPKPSFPIETNELCSYGCGNIAKYRTCSGKLCCEGSVNKCSYIRQKNSDSTKETYRNGRVSALTKTDRQKGANNSGEIRMKKSEWYRTNAQWELVPRRAWYDRILHDQGGVCDICKCQDVWNGMPLRFHLDHIHGKQHGDDRNNLRLICPNCHSQTPTYGSKNASPEGRTKILDALKRGNKTSWKNRRE